jgi:hypothetical protein
MVRNSSSRVWLLGLIFLAAPLSAQIEIRQCVPLAVSRNKTNEITFTGENVDGASGLWTSFKSSWKRLPGGSQGQAKFSVVIEDTGAAGTQTVQLYGEKGASNFRLISIDPLPAVEATGMNRKREQAQNLNVPAAVDGVFKNESADFYSFKATAGEMVTLEMMSRRLGLAPDPVLRLLDEEGRELAFVEDDPLGERDSRVEFVAPTKGTYFVDIHDVGYQGGKDFQYRLRMGLFPLLSYSYPLGVESGKETIVELLGPKVQSTVLVEAQPAEPARSFVAVGNSFVPVLVDKLREETEVEPNNSPEQANPVATGAVWNGRFQSAGDVDVFAFEAAKEEQLVFRGETRSAGSACDLVLKLLNANGKVLAESNPADPGEGSITNRFSESGRYFLQASELVGQHGPAVVYRVVAEHAAPFGLSTETDRLAAPAGGSVNVKLAITRNGYDGPMHIEFEKPLPNLTIEGGLAGPGKKEVEVKIVVSANAPAGELVHFRLTGQHEEQPGLSGQVSTLPALKKNFPALLHPPRELDGLLSLYIGGGKPTTTAAQ